MHGKNIVRYTLLCSALMVQSALQPQKSPSNGETQVARMLQDRPKLASILDAHAHLRDWVTQEFDTTRGGLKLQWDGREPISGRAAEHEYPSRADRVAAGTAVVRVSAELTSWDQLTGLVFEMHNFRGCVRFEEIHQAAVNGTIDKSEYARQCLEQEFVAQKATKKFLEQYVAVLPGAGRDESRLFWHKLHSEDSLDAHLRKYEQMGSKLTAHYEQLYEQEVVPELEQERK